MKSPFNLISWELVSSLFYVAANVYEFEQKRMIKNAILKPLP